MALHRTKQRILKAIAEGFNSEPALADHLGTIMDVMRYHLESLEEDDYIKCRRGAPTDKTSDRLWIYEIWLTDKGKETVTNLPDSLAVMSEPVPLASVPMNVPANRPAPKPAEPELATAGTDDSSVPSEAVLAQAIAEIQKRIQQLYGKYPAEKTSEQYQLASRILHYLESNSMLKGYAIAAAKQQRLKSLQQTDVGRVVVGAIEGWAKE